MTRPDIAYAVHVVSQFMHVPRTTHLHAVKRIFKYLQGTLVHGLLLRPSADSRIIVAYSDVDWAGCKDTCRSTTGYVVYFGPNLISRRSKKQPTVSTSFTEAEYRVVGYIVAKTIWIRELLHDLHITITTPTRLYCDNVSATFMTANPVQHDRSKHIVVDSHFCA